MDFQLSPKALALREEAREFVRREWNNPGLDLTGGLAAWHGDTEQREHGHHVARQFAKKLISQGWYTMHWPKEYGGQDASIEEQLAFREVMSYEDAPGWRPGGAGADGPRRGLDEEGIPPPNCLGRY